jgi:hypothetical protein
MKIETDEWVTPSEAAACLGVTPSRVNQMANQGLVESVRPWPHVRLIGRRSVAERFNAETRSRVSRGTAMRWIAARHGVTGHPVRPDRITADMNRVIAGLDPKALSAEVYQFVTEARPHWSESRRTAYVRDLVAQIRPPAR